MSHPNRLHLANGSICRHISASVTIFSFGGAASWRIVAKLESFSPFSCATRKGLLPSISFHRWKVDVEFFRCHRSSAASSSSRALISSCCSLLPSFRPSSTHFLAIKWAIWRNWPLVAPLSATLLSSSALGLPGPGLPYTHYCREKNAPPNLRLHSYSPLSPKLKYSPFLSSVASVASAISV